MEMRDLKITLENLPTLLDLLHADPEWVAALTTEEKQVIIDKANLVIETHYGG